MGGCWIISSIVFFSNFTFYFMSAYHNVLLNLTHNYCVAHSIFHPWWWQVSHFRRCASTKSLHIIAFWLHFVRPSQMRLWSAFQSFVFLNICTYRIRCCIDCNQLRRIIAKQNVCFVRFECAEELKNIFQFSTSSEFLRQRQECMRQTFAFICAAAAAHKHARR